MFVALLVDIDSSDDDLLQNFSVHHLHGVISAADKKIQADLILPAELILIGADSENPILSAQQLMQLHPDAELVIISAPEKQAFLSRLLLTTPYIPVGTRVLDSHDKVALDNTLSDALKRIESKKQHAQAVPPSADRFEKEKCFSDKLDVNLENQRRLFSAVVETSGAAIFTLSLQGIITSWNPAAETLYGYSPQQAIGSRIDFILPPSRQHEFELLFDRLKQQDRVSQYETEHVHREGQRLNVLLSLSPIKDYQGAVSGISIIAHDLTEKKRTQSYVEEMQAHQTAILEAALDSIITMNHQGLIVEYNPAAEKMFGYSRKEAVGTPLEELIIPPSLRNAHRKGLQHFLSTGQGPVLGKRMELSAIRRDGSEFPVEVSILQLQGRNPPIFTGFLRDLTERKAAEKESHQLLEDLRRSNEELEQFAYIASHDLKEPLRMVASFSELLTQRYSGKLDEKADKYIHYIIDGATRMGRMIDDLLTYSRVGSRDRTFTLTDGAEAVRKALSALSVALRESNAAVTYGTLPKIYGNNSLLSEVFQNLLHNAIKFRSERPLTIDIQATQENDEWIFSVADNGIGFDMEHSRRIFQMFQRLHQRDKFEGTGVGLALVKKIIERHGGKVWVNAKPDQGATFYFSLPVNPDAKGDDTNGTH